ncbi:MAG: maleylpyruvate isomerase N-terminal domain-containing protein [Dehalococcoidia bacterium]
MDKQTALAKLDEQFNALLTSIKGLDEATMSQQFYGDWNVKDILAHIAGWQHTMREAMERMARGEKPVPEGVDYTDADAWNAGFASAMKAQNAETIIANLRQAYANYARAAAAIPNDRYGEGKTINRLLEASGYGHIQEHLPEIQSFASGKAPR